MGLCMCIPPADCKQKHSCYRYRKIPHEFNQSMAELFEPSKTDPSIKCLNFIAIEGRKIHYKGD